MYLIHPINGTCRKSHVANDECSVLKKATALLEVLHGTSAISITDRCLVVPYLFQILSLCPGLEQNSSLVSLIQQLIADILFDVYEGITKDRSCIDGMKFTSCT